jgi:hypothetical protein
LLGRLTRTQWQGVLANDARGEPLEVARSGEWDRVRTFLAEPGCELAHSELNNKEQAS